jgi:hypothetical protein
VEKSEILQKFQQSSSLKFSFDFSYPDRDTLFHYPYYPKEGTFWITISSEVFIAEFFGICWKVLFFFC